MSDTKFAVRLNREANDSLTQAYVLQMFALSTVPDLGPVEALKLAADLEAAIQQIENKVFELTGARVWLSREEDELELGEVV